MIYLFVVLAIVTPDVANAQLFKDVLKDIQDATGAALDTIKQGKDLVRDARQVGSETEELIQQIQYQDTYTLRQAEIFRLQAKLNSLGYDAGEVDGALGRGTRTAVKEFQRQNGFKADGAISLSLFNMILSSNVRAEVQRELVRDEWREVQDLLNSSGYSVGVADGIPGKRTYSALNAYIAANNIQHLAHSERLVFDHLKSQSSVQPTTQVQLDEEVALLSVEQGQASEQLPQPEVSAPVNASKVNGDQLQDAETASSTIQAAPTEQVNHSGINDCDAIADAQKQSACMITEMLLVNKQAIYNSLLGNLSADKQPAFIKLENHWQKASKQRCLDDNNCISTAIQERLAFLSSLYQPAAMDAHLLKANKLPGLETKEKGENNIASTRDVEILVYDCAVEPDSKRQQTCLIAKSLFQSITSTCRDDQECIRQRVLQQYSTLENIYDFPDLAAYKATIIRMGNEKNINALQQVGLESGVQGLWHGNTSCKSNRKPMDLEVELTVAGPSNGIFNLGFVASHENSLSSGVIKQQYVGEPVPGASGKIRFVVSKAHGRLFGINLESFIFDTSSSSIEFTEVGCDRIVVLKQTENTDRMKPTVSLPPKGSGNYWTAENNRARCEVLIEWAEKVNKEYPGKDFYRSNKPGDYLRTIKVFGDNDFVPVFGTPYDELSYDVRLQINRLATRTCTNDPFTKSRMETYYAIANRIMPGNPKRELASNGYSSTIFAIRKMRSVRNQINRLSADGFIETGTFEFLQQEKQLLDLKKSTSANSEILWPSERKNLDEQIDSELVKLAVLKSDSLLHNLGSIEDPIAGLQASYIGGSESEKNTYLKYLRREQKSQFLERIGGVNAGFAQQLVDPILNQMQIIPVTVDGLLEVKVLSEKPLPHSRHIEEPYKKQVAVRFAKEIDKRIDALLDTMLAQLPQFAPNRDGVKGSADWGNRFAKQFKVFEDSSKVRAAEDAYLAHREKLLEISIGQFELELESVTGEERINALLSDYLSWVRDEEIPIALEYQFLAELSR